jgi:aspartate-semialdehyde dehydrogenase
MPFYAMPSFQDKIFVVVGATGIVGQEFLKILRQNNVPSNNIKLIASEKSVGTLVPYGPDFLPIQGIRNFNFAQCQVGLFSPGAQVSSQYAPIAARQGCWVIDNTSFFRMADDVPLIIPEVNAAEIANAPRRIIANPNCSTIQLVMALKPIHDLCCIKKVIVATYQSVSGAGKDAIMELRGEPQRKVVFPRGIKGNIIPQIDVWGEDGCTKEEWKMNVETKKILGREIDVVATCVRVPVEFGHSEAVCFELAAAERPVDLPAIHVALRAFPGVHVEDLGSNNYKTPKEVAGTDEVFVSRLRQDKNTGLYQMWVVADNVRKGAALNAVQIAQRLVAMGEV